MKKIFSILFAGIVGLMAASCVQEPLATFDATKATAPILGTSEIGAKGVTVTYTPGSFDMGFNEKMATNHVLALVSADGKAVSKIVTTTGDKTSLSATFVNISKALSFLGYKDGDLVSNVQLAVRATMQNLSQDNGINGFVDSEDRVTFDSFTVTLPVGSPYADYTEATTWSVIGALSNYDINWNGDLEMFATSDGKRFVAKAIKLAKNDQFKFRKDESWDVNYGAPGEDEPFVVSLDSEIQAKDGGKNLAVPADGTYDLWLDLSGDNAVITVTDAYLPYPAFTQSTTWSVIGALSNYDINWNGDLAMSSDGTSVLAQGIKLAKNDQFKFRKDASWDENFGATGETEPFVVTLGSETPAKDGGKNLAVPEDGVYDLLLNLEAKTFTIVETLGGGVSGKVGGVEPKPQPTGWGLIGVNGDWNNDIAATEKDGVWTASFEAAEATTFKWRKDADWAENYGLEKGGTYTVGEPFAAVAGGDDIPVEAGSWTVVLDLSNAEAPTITVSETKASGWSVIGDFNGWGADADMTQVAPGIWISEELEINEGGWKVRFGHDWAVNRGGATPAAEGEFVAAYPGGDNISLNGKFRVVYNENNQTIGTLVWGVVGKISAIEGFNWNNDIPMNLASDGKWYSVPVTLAADDEIKIRYKADWADDRGGDAAAADEAFEVKKGGSNIKAPEAGTYMVVYDPTAETITLSTDFWSLIGEFNGWNGDRFLLPAGDGKWSAFSQEISGGWKIRKGADWTVSAGGTYAEAGVAFEAVTDNGPNICVTDLTRFDVVYDTAAGTITVSKPVK